MPMKTPSDEDKEEGVLQQTTGPTPLRDETVDDDDEKNEMSAPKGRKTHKKEKKKTYIEATEETERDGYAGTGSFNARDAMSCVQHHVKDANGSLKMETVQLCTGAMRAGPQQIATWARVTLNAQKT